MRVDYVRLRGEKKSSRGGWDAKRKDTDRPELVAFVLALRSIPMLHLCDNQVLLRAVERWEGEGGKAVLVGAPDEDILVNLWEAIELPKRTTAAGAATLLTKVKAHRGEPANEEADIQADKAISGKNVATEWHDRTNRAVFTWQEPRRNGCTVRYEDRKSTWNGKVRKVIRRGSAEEEVRKNQDRAPSDRSLKTNQQTQTTSQCKL